MMIHFFSIHLAFPYINIRERAYPFVKEFQMPASELKSKFIELGRNHFATSFLG